MIVNFNYAEFLRYAPIGRSSSREPSVDNTGLSRDMGVPWRRSASRDLATDIDSVFKSPVQTPTQTATLPRGGKYEITIFHY